MNGRWYDADSHGIGRNRKNTILIISENGYHDLYRALTLEGEVIEIYGYKGALARFKKSGADIVLMDRGHNSSVCLDLILEMKATAPDVPIIVLSGDDPSQELMAGARLFLKKPVDILELKITVSKLLNLKRTSREKRTPLSLGKNSQKEVSAAAKSDQPVNILRVIQYIENNFAEKINLETLAQQANLSKFHFCRFFTKHTGMSPMRFVNLLRIEKAKEFLGRHDQTVSIISFLAGYNDLGTFIRQFKSKTGLTPADYKRTTM